MGRIIRGDCVEKMNLLQKRSVDSIVCDPPYEIGFMGKGWDSAGVAFAPSTWKAALRVLKPGGYLLAFGGTRTEHRMTCAVEDAGFEIRDKIMWVYGSGMPKSKNLPGGLGTALKPAYEPIVVARKPLSGTVEENVHRHGTGVLRIDSCRIPTNGERPKGSGNGSKKSKFSQVANSKGNGGNVTPEAGRWPANLILDEEAGAALGTASRFFYCAKPSKKERGDSDHPTMKPVALMRYLCRLVTRPGGLVLDPFAGSGTTAVACIREGFDFIAIEKNREYKAILKSRIRAAREE